MINPNKNIYDIYLVSVSQYAEVDPKDSIKTNIKRAIMDNELQILKRILVQETSSHDQFREIVTDKIFQGCISYTDWQYKLTHEQKLSNPSIDEYAFIKPIYITIPLTYIGYRKDIYRDKWIKPEIDRIFEYTTRHIDKEKYIEELNQTYEMAKNNYEIATSNFTKKIKYKKKRLVKEEQ